MLSDRLPGTKQANERLGVTARYISCQAAAGFRSREPPPVLERPFFLINGPTAPSLLGGCGPLAAKPALCSTRPASQPASQHQHHLQQPRKHQHARSLARSLDNSTPRPPSRAYTFVPVLLSAITRCSVAFSNLLLPLHHSAAFGSSLKPSLFVTPPLALRPLNRPTGPLTLVMLR